MFFNKYFNQYKRVKSRISRIKTFKVAICKQYNYIVCINILSFRCRITLPYQYCVLSSNIVINNTAQTNFRLLNFIWNKNYYYSCSMKCNLFRASIQNMQISTSYLMKFHSYSQEIHVSTICRCWIIAACTSLCSLNRRRLTGSHNETICDTVCFTYVCVKYALYVYIVYVSNTLSYFQGIF